MTPRHTLYLALALPLVGGCTVTAWDADPAYVDGYADVDYQPLYYNGSVVYYDGVGAPYYYRSGAPYYISRSYARYGVYASHYRAHRYGYHSWARHHHHSYPAAYRHRVHHPTHVRSHHYRQHRSHVDRVHRTAPRVHHHPSGSHRVHRGHRGGHR